MTKELFVERLNSTMKKRNIRITELANRSGIDKGTVNAYTKGRYRPKQENVKKMADVLNVDDIWLAGYDDDEAWNLSVKRAEDSINNFIKGMKLCGFSDDQTDILMMYKELTPEQQDIVNKFIELYHEKNEEEMMMDANLQG